MLLPSPAKAKLAAGQIAPVLLQREHVGEGLARMEFIAQRVNHRHARPVGQLFDGPLRKRARDNGVRPALQIAGNVFDWLAIADRARVQDRVSTELLDGKLEGHARPQRRFFEEQAQIPSAQGASVARRLRFELGRKSEQPKQLVAAHVQVRQKIARGNPRRHFERSVSGSSHGGHEFLFSHLNNYTGGPRVSNQANTGTNACATWHSHSWLCSWGFSASIIAPPQRHERPAQDRDCW